jgi:ribonuclease HI
LVPKEATVIYTDGSAVGTNPGPAGAGYYIPNLSICLRRGEFAALGVSTNNRAEIMAIFLAINAADHWFKSPRKIVIMTDSLFAIGVLDKGHSTKSSPILIAITKTLREMSRHEISFIHCPAHCGLMGNEIADRIANRGSAESSQGTGTPILQRTMMLPASPPNFMSATSLFEAIASAGRRPPVHPLGNQLPDIHISSSDPPIEELSSDSDP